MHPIRTPNVTVAIADTKNHGLALAAIQKTLQQITPDKVLFFTDINIKESQFTTVKIPRITSKEDYSDFIIKKLYHHITSTHVLIIQHDGYVIDGSQWSSEFMSYDYIGALWLYSDGKANGNGGFSLRSKNLMWKLAEDKFIEITSPEDEITCRLYRSYLEKKHRIKFAPDEVCERFSYELRQPHNKTFGFHGYFYQAFKEHIVLKRSGAMGDVIMMEPVMEWFDKKGYQVVLDCPRNIFNLFSNHYFPIKHTSQLSSKIKCREINLDMSYEVTPKQPVLQSYYQMCGIEDGEMRNSKLICDVSEKTELFKNLCVIHIDDTAMPHRNIRGVNWWAVIEFLEHNGFTVIQISKGKHKTVATEFNCASESMLKYLLASAVLFIGGDSGCAQVAVALGTPSIIMFQSVNAKFRYTDFDKIAIIQGACVKEETAFCYHNVIGVRGQECIYDKELPPCSVFTTMQVMAAIANLAAKYEENMPQPKDKMEVESLVE